MKSRTLVVLVVAAFVTVMAAYAQSTARLSANIPFEFRVGNSVLAAGEYEIIPISTPRTLLVRSADGEAAVVALTNTAEKLLAPKDGKLVFNRYGNTYFLSQVWHPGINRGYELPKSKSEREMAQNAARTELAYIKVTVQ